MISSRVTPTVSVIYRRVMQKKVYEYIILGSVRIRSFFTINFGSPLAFSMSLVWVNSVSLITAQIIKLLKDTSWILVGIGLKID